MPTLEEVGLRVHIQSSGSFIMFQAMQNNIILATNCVGRKRIIFYNVHTRNQIQVPLLIGIVLGSKVPCQVLSSTVEEERVRDKERGRKKCQK